MAFIKEFAQSHIDLIQRNDRINPALYEKYSVKRGLRDVDGDGVLAGITNISQIISTKDVDGRKQACGGELWYRGYRINELIENLGDELGFEKIAYLLLMGEIPSDSELAEFKTVLGEARTLPSFFTRDIIMKAPTGDIMKSMMRSILAYSYYDQDALDTSIGNSLRQCLELISTFPLFAAYAYHSYHHYKKGGSMYIHMPDSKLSAAENLFSLLRPNRQYTHLEAKALDTALILHMEHGGGNNSSFTTRVVTSAGSDTYSTMTAAMASLKGSRHGGASLKFMSMMGDIREHVRDWYDRDEVAAYIQKIVNKEAFDRTGLVYGIGHAVYMISDPRGVILKKYIKRLVREKGCFDADLALHENIEAVAPEIIAKARNMPHLPAPNVDFYSGALYYMLDVPPIFYTALFAIARIVGWSAHRLEELITSNKIIRPAYKSVVK